MTQVALAWVLAKPGVAAPIVGTTSLASLAELLGKPLVRRGGVGSRDGADAGAWVEPAGALEVTLDEEELQYLEEPYAPMR